MLTMDGDFFANEQQKALRGILLENILAILLPEKVYSEVFHFVKGYLFGKKTEGANQKDLAKEMMNGLLEDKDSLNVYCWDAVSGALEIVEKQSLHSLGLLTTRELLVLIVEHFKQCEEG